MKSDIVRGLNKNDPDYWLIDSWLFKLGFFYVKYYYWLTVLNESAFTKAFNHFLSKPQTSYCRLGTIFYRLTSPGWSFWAWSWEISSADLVGISRSTWLMTLIDYFTICRVQIQGQMLKRDISYVYSEINIVFFIFLFKHASLTDELRQWHLTVIVKNQHSLFPICLT